MTLSQQSATIYRICASRGDAAGRKLAVEIVGQLVARASIGARNRRAR